jgi:fructan beta-fructosidase
MKKLFIFCCLNFMMIGANQIFAQDTVRHIKVAKGQVYLNLPVSESNKLTRTRILHEGKVLDQFSLKLASGQPDYWVYFDVAPYQGKTIALEISNADVPAGGAFTNITQVSNRNRNVTGEDRSKALQMVFASAQFPGADSLYKETKRPQVHFSSRRGWINDPNGLLYYNGEYHMFYQHNPYGWAWGNMHWGHAASKDLVHWKELGEAIYPFGEKDAAFSGSAVVDAKNTSGFRKNGIDPLIAVYTSTGRGECLKLSYDNGKTFTEYEGNPILKHNGRDPKVFWYEPGNHWVMVVWDMGRTKKMSSGDEAIINQHLIYTSPDLKSWTYQSGVAGFFECPELFELPVEGEQGTSKWVMYDATGRYVLGDFDGKKFTVSQHLKQYDFGGGYFYASQTYNSTPDNRRIQVGWGRGIVQTGMPFNQAMLFPTELKLKKTFDGLRLCPAPIKEIRSLHQNSQAFENRIIRSNAGLTVPVSGEAIHVVAEFEKGDATQFGLNVLGYELSYNDLMGEFTTALDARLTNTNYVRPGTENFKIEAIVDKNMLEVFVNDGELYYAVPFDADKNGKIDVFVKGRGTDRKALVKRMEVHELRSIWTNAAIN